MLNCLQSRVCVCVCVCVSRIFVADLTLILSIATVNAVAMAANRWAM